MKREDLLSIGFKELPHKTVGGMVIYDLGRDRHLTAASVGTPNEMLFISETAWNNPKKVTDSICLWNFDYDGLLTIERVINIIKALTGKDVNIQLQNNSESQG